MVTLTDRLWLIIATEKADNAGVKMFGPFDGYNAAADAQVELATQFPDYRFQSRPLRDPATATEVLS